MTHLLVVILHDLSRLPVLLEGWKRIGVPGATLLRSVGGYQAENWLEKIGLGGLGRLLDQEELRQKVLFSVISDEALLEQAIAEADEIVEGFDRPHSGILFTIPVDHTLGIRKRGLPEYQSADEHAPPGGKLEPFIRQDTRVEVLLDVMNLEPVIVHRTSPLPDLVNAMVSHPNIQVICVTNDENRLVGLIDIETLSNAFFISIFPSEFLSDLKDLDQALRLAQNTQAHRAEDIMSEPVWVKINDSLEKSYHLMHKHKLTGIPVLDDHYHIIGYINLSELMSVCLDR